MNNDRAMKLIERAMKNKHTGCIIKPFEEIIDHVEACDKKVEKYKKQLEEYSKDKEIQKLKDEIMNLRRLSIAILNEKEYESYKEFINEHYDRCKNGPKYSIIITGTSLGDIYEVRCEQCGEKKNITDLESW